MGSFDAGSIEGRLDLDTHPFAAGLDEARARADEWEAQPIRKRVELDDSEARAKMDAFDAEEDRRTIKQRLELDTRPAERQADEYRAKERVKNAASGGAGGGGVGAGSGGGGLGGLAGLGIPALIGAGLGVAPALSPVVTAAGLDSIAGGSMFAQFAGATMLLKVMATEAIKNAQAAAKTVSTPLPKGATAIQRANYAKAQETISDSKKMLGDITKLQSTWQSLYQDPALFRVIDKGATTLDAFLPKLQPLISSIAKGFIPVVNELGRSLEGSGFHKFEGMLQNNYKTLIPVWGDSIIKALGGIGGIMEATNPEMTSFSHTFDSMMGRFNKWSQDGGAKKFFDSWSAYDAQFKPQLHQLGSDTLGGVGHLFGPQGLGNPTLVNNSIGMLDGLFRTLEHADLKPFRDAVSGFQASETALGGGIGKALPGILSAVGAFTHLTAQVDWKIVGTSINYAADGVTKVASAFGDLNKHFDGALGTIAGIGVDALIAKKLIGMIPGVGGGKGAGGVLGAAESAIGIGGGKGTAVYVTNWPAGGMGRVGNSVVGTVASDAEKAGAGAAGYSLWGAVKGVSRDFRATSKTDGLLSAAGDLPASISAYGSMSKIGSLLGKVGNVAEHISPEGLAFLIAGMGGGSGLGKNVRTDPYGGLYSPSVQQSGSNKFFGSFLPGLQSDGSPQTPKFYFPRGTHLTADSTVGAGSNGLNYDNGSARVPGTANYALLQELARTGLLSGVKQNKGFLQYSGTEAALTSAIKMLADLSHVNKHGMLASPGKNFGVVPVSKDSWTHMYQGLGVLPKHLATEKAAPWDAIVKYLAQTAAAVHSPKGIAGIIDVKKWEHDLGAGFTAALKEQMNPAKVPPWAAAFIGVGAKHPAAAASSTTGKIDPGLAQLLSPTMRIADATKQSSGKQDTTNQRLVSVHTALGTVDTSVGNVQSSVSSMHRDLVSAINALGPAIASSVNSANAAQTQRIITGVRAGQGHK